MPREPVKFLYTSSGHANGHVCEASKQAPCLAGWPNHFEGRLKNSVNAPVIAAWNHRMQSSGPVPRQATLIQNTCEAPSSRLLTFAASLLTPILLLHLLHAPSCGQYLTMSGILAVPSTMVHACRCVARSHTCSPLKTFWYVASSASPSFAPLL